MSFSLPSSILDLKGQCVNNLSIDIQSKSLTINCRRDKRFKPRDADNRPAKTVNRYTRRTIQDIPIFGYRLYINAEIAQIVTQDNKRRMEQIAFVETGSFYSIRYCKLISGLCRYMSISSVADHFKMRWETVKNMDKMYLEATLPNLDPSQLTDLQHIGVDEVARAKGHDYMTVVYDMESGRLIWVEKGRTSDVFSSFLNQLPETTKQGIKAVAMDMGPAYQKAVNESLPNADIVFDRFHVMKNYSKAIDAQRRAEFKNAEDIDKELIKGSRYLLLRNPETLTDEQKKKLGELLKANENINTLYILKEQLQSLWYCQTFESMSASLISWCELAEETGMKYIKKFARSLRVHRVGICNYAKYHLTSGRIEAGNVGIGMLRKRARGIKDTEYFKLKIRQLSTPLTGSMFFKEAMNELI